MGIPATGLAKTGLVNLIIPLLNPVYLWQPIRVPGLNCRVASSRLVVELFLQFEGYEIYNPVTPCGYPAAHCRLNEPRLGTAEIGRVGRRRFHDDPCWLRRVDPDGRELTTTLGSSMH
jgi:hypothetical protein